MDIVHEAFQVQQDLRHIRQAILDRITFIVRSAQRALGMGCNWSDIRNRRDTKLFVFVSGVSPNIQNTFKEFVFRGFSSNVMLIEQKQNSFIHTLL